MMNYFGNSLGSWLAYWGEGYAAWLFIGSLLLLLILSIKNKRMRPLTAVTLMTLFLFFLPITPSVMSAVNQGNIYWRLIWLIPCLGVIAAALTSLIRLIPKTGLQAAAVGAAVILIAFCGKDQISADNFVAAENIEQVPPFIVDIAENIREEGPEDCCVAAVDVVSSYLRIYAPDIKLAYGRVADGYINRAAVYLYYNVQAAENTLAEIPPLADEAGVNCVVIRTLGEVGDVFMESQGWQKTGDIDAFTIYCKQAHQDDHTL